MKYAIIFALALFLFPRTALAQTCYVRLTDASGYTPTAGQLDALEQAAAALCAVFDSAGFGGQFKVYDFGFYLHHETTTGGYPEPFARKVQEVAALSPYYLLFGKQSDRSGVYTRFWVEFNLPNISGSSCPNNFDELTKAYFLDVFNSEIEPHPSVPEYFYVAAASGLLKLKEYVSHLKLCCEQGIGIDTCIVCTSHSHKRAYLSSLGFSKTPISDVIPNTDPYTSDEIVNYANLLFSINDLTAVDIGKKYAAVIDSFNLNDLSVKIIVTNDDDICSADWSDLTALAESAQHDVVFWHHIHEGNGTNDQFLYGKIFYKDSDTENKLNRGPDPFSFVLGFLGSFATDALMQLGINYLIDEVIDEGDWTKAAQKINYGSSFVSGIMGGLGLDLKKLKYAASGAIALGTVAYNVATNSSYSKEEGVRDFIVTFITSYIGISAGPHIVGKLKNLGIDRLSSKAFKKFSSLFRDGNSLSKKEVDLAWWLSANGESSILNPKIRGLQMQQWAYESYYKTLGYKNMGDISEFFPAIDFYHFASKIGISVKTTNVTTYEGLKKALQKNIVDLQTFKDARLIKYNQKDYPLEQTKLMVLVPEENVSTVNNKVIQLMNELDPSNKINSIEVKSIEMLLNL